MENGNRPIDRLQAAIIKRQLQDRRSSVPRNQALIRDQNACRVCGHSVALHVHHIVERQHGGPDRLDNLITLCSNHHIMAHRGFLSASQLHDLISAGQPGTTPIENEEEDIDELLPSMNVVKPLSRIIIGKGPVH